MSGWPKIRSRFFGRCSSETLSEKVERAAHRYGARLVNMSGLDISEISAGIVQAGSEGRKEARPGPRKKWSRQPAAYVYFRLLKKYTTAACQFLDFCRKVNIGLMKKGRGQVRNTVRLISQHLSATWWNPASDHAVHRGSGPYHPYPVHMNRKRSTSLVFGPVVQMPALNRPRAGRRKELAEKLQMPLEKVAR